MKPIKEVKNKNKKKSIPEKACKDENWTRNSFPAQKKPWEVLNHHNLILVSKPVYTVSHHCYVSS